LKPVYQCAPPTNPHQRRALDHAALTAANLLTGRRTVVDQWLYHPWTGVISFLEADGQRYVAKSSHETQSLAVESRNLATVQTLGLDVAEMVAYHDGVLLQRRIPGIDLQHRLDAGDFRLPLFLLNAARTLARFHAGTERADTQHLENTFEATTLEQRLQTWRSEIASTISTRDNRRNEQWLRALQRIDTSSLVETLAASGNEATLSHNDSKLRNFIGSDCGRVTLIDFQTLSLGSPWFDVAHLCGKLDRRTQRAVLHAYVDEAKQHGLLEDLSSKQIHERFDAALTYYQLHAAYSCGKLLPVNEGFLQPLHDGLDGLRRQTDGDARMILSELLDLPELAAG
jgi:aminoglycoside phosphotransferase (APT) family kinase protein